MKYLLYKLMQLEDDADANALGTNDPTIKANVGFNFEVYSIPQAVSLRSTLKSGKINISNHFLPYYFFSFCSIFSFSISPSDPMVFGAAAAFC
jgi:hypothetical protein